MKKFIARFKSLPLKTRQLLILGTTLALVVALPLFIWAILTQRFELRKRAATGEPTPPPSEKMTKKVALVVINPKDTSGVGVIQKYGWDNPETLANQYIEAVREASNNTVDYQIAERLTLEDFPVKKSGFTLDMAYYENCLSNPNANCRELIDYAKFLESTGLCPKIANGQIHEIWAFGGPWFGFWEWSVKGPHVNSLQENLPHCGRKTYAIMGFSYERTVSEMLEDLGHRFEYILPQLSHTHDAWSRYVQKSHCGTVHIPPNGTTDYDWSNQSVAPSDCDDYLTYPNLPGNVKQISCATWGCGKLGHKKWWFNHIPHNSGQTGQTLHNWWKYVIDTDNALATQPPNPSPVPTIASPTPTQCTSCDTQYGLVYTCQFPDSETGTVSYGRCSSDRRTAQCYGKSYCCKEGYWTNDLTYCSSTPTPAKQIMRFRIRFVGVNDDAAEGAKITVRFLNDSLKNTYGQNIYVNLITPPLPLIHVGDGIYEASIEIINPLPAGPGYTVFVKGEKHLARKFCIQKGQSVRCTGNGFITVSSSPQLQVFDFVGLALEPGDLPPQDGKADSGDFAKITSLFTKLCSALTGEEKKIADLDYNGCINVRDAFLMRKTLEVKFDEY